MLWVSSITPLTLRSHEKPLKTQRVFLCHQSYDLHKDVGDIRHVRSCWKLFDVPSWQIPSSLFHLNTLQFSFRLHPIPHSFKLKYFHYLFIQLFKCRFGIKNKSIQRFYYLTLKFPVSVHILFSINIWPRCGVKVNHPVSGLLVHCMTEA